MKTDFILGIIPRIVTLYLSPILCLIGFLLFIFPSIANPETIKSALRYWTIFGIGLGFLIIFELLVWFFSNDIVLFIVYVIGFSYYLVLVYIILKNIRLEIKSDKAPQDILSMFARPQKINIKEITYSKEHKVCLVCKGKVEELSAFDCSHCAVLYCQNCAQTLSNLENACWVCNTPFDKSKPSKPFKLEEEEIDIEAGEKDPEKTL